MGHGHLAPLEGHLADAAAAAPGRRRRRFGGTTQPVLGQVGGVGEAGGLAPHDADSGTTVEARRELLDLAVVETGRGRALVLREHLREVAARLQGHAQDATNDAFLYQRRKPPANTRSRW